MYSVNLVKTAGALPEMLMTANIWVCLWKLLRQISTLSRFMNVELTYLDLDRRLFVTPS